MECKSIYIHIPFCSSICSYCDFCKFFYNETWVDNYLNVLEEEIKSKYKGEKINTLYIGGGTPTCLNLKQLEKLLKICDYFNKEIDFEFTLETNVELNLEKIKLLKKYGVNRISIGVQSIDNNNLKFLKRNHTKKQVINLIKTLKENGIDNINCDLIYAIKDETLKTLENDLDFLINLNINHISTYSLMIEPHTKLYIDNAKNIDDEIDYKMYKLINKKLKQNGFIHYEISNFCKEGYQSRHNLVYWNNQNYYGFGIGASGYINDIRYDNTRSYSDYIKGNYVSNYNKLSLNETIENEFILGFRKIDGIDINEFKTKYNIDIKDIDIVNKLLKENKLIISNNKIKINDDYIYTSNNILINFIDLNIY